MKCLVSLICVLLLTGYAASPRADQVTTSSDVPATDVVVQEKDIAVTSNSKSSSEQLLEAMENGQSNRLPQLLAAGADPNFRDPDQEEGGCKLSAVDNAIRRGNHSALDLLLGHGGRIESPSKDRDTCTALGLAVLSRDEAMVHRISSLTKVPLSMLCMADDSELVSTFLKTTDSFWGMLISEGFGNPSSNSTPCAALAPIGERLVLALMEPSVSYNTTLVGWQNERLNARLKDLWRPEVVSGLISEKRVEDLRQVASDRCRDDILRALEKVGVPNSPSASGHDEALRTRLPGEYHLLDSSDTMATVILNANGKFKYSGVQSGGEFQVEGGWSVRNGRVMFNTDEARRASGWVPYKRLSTDGESPPADVDPKLVFVKVMYGGFPLLETSAMAVGCEPPQMDAGITGDKDYGMWVGRIKGKVCQIVLERLNFDGGRSFVYEVPKDADPVLSRYFLFELQSTEGRFDFNHEMSVENGELVLRDMEEEYHFARQ